MATRKKIGGKQGPRAGMKDKGGKKKILGRTVTKTKSPWAGGTTTKTVTTKRKTKEVQRSKKRTPDHPYRKTVMKSRRR